MNIYVGHLASDITGRDLREAFASFGRVETAAVMRHHHSDESRGYGFVGMPSRDEATSAIVGLHGTPLQGQALTATELPPRDPVSGACRARCHCQDRAESADPLSLHDGSLRERPRRR